MSVNVLTDLLSVDFGLLSSDSGVGRSACFGRSGVGARACAQLSCGPGLGPDMYAVWAVVRLGLARI